MKTNSPVTWVHINSWKDNQLESKNDLLAVEEPLQIKLQFGSELAWKEKALTVTMRTPGHDFELAIGFLLAENIIQKKDDIQLIRYCKKGKPEEKGNVLIVKLEPSVEFDQGILDRQFLTNSSCGICGKSAIDSISTLGKKMEPGIPKIKSELLSLLNERLMEVQVGFKYTGGMHAAALFNLEGDLLILREDVGRHNAFDKVVGAALEKGSMPLNQHLMMLSGRISFELVQKSIKAGIPILVAVGAPSSLAVSMAEEKGITLIGFLKSGSFNIYSGKERIFFPD
ncbi:formate dehydrogenase accessory sulfurtransferase FdhD [Aquiflexum sp.]|uniref:formate dehydrogenase accessory sulfurtransferase FdhD n=1 Tax=Aquiflexum sp. TaxID=1872584 RepID=UPI0035939A25